ncbi:MAG TPA: peptidylprolyl isomerase, partial [Fibrobacteria bacterium]|nr:peptidylprolyl isomerase [Fibrobacteria bacterium]
MVLMWMKSKAPWVIFTFGILILVGLLWMGENAKTGGNQRQGNIVGKVDGKEIPASEFQNELKNYLANEERRSGKAPEGAQLIQFREGLFNYKVQALLMEGVHEDYQLHPSSREMMAYVYKNPREVAMYIAQFEGPDALPAFMRDSVIDQGRYEAWLSQDTVYDRFGLRRLEDQLRGTTVPQSQLNAIMRSQLHSTSLEEAFSIANRENKAKVVYYHVPADSFQVPADKFKDADLKAFFEANPDSFHFSQDAARLGYVRIPIHAAKADTALMFEFAKEIKERAQGGESFAELAKSYSGDPGSAEQGGSLGGPRGKEGLDPVFAAAAWSLDIGAISDPVLTPFGYHV